ncbi:MAG: CocE/NonD family hydrolase, partial [Rubrobacter sp.]
EDRSERETSRGTNKTRSGVGPGTHADFGSRQGDLDFGLAASGGFLDARETLSDLQLRFFDARLKGDETALADEPPVRVFVMGENRWRSFEDWPPQDASTQDWHLGAEGTLTPQVPGGGTPGGGTPGGGSVEYDYDPLHPVPTLGGQTLLAPVYGAGPMDQRPIESRPDVLVFTSEPLEKDLTILGPVHATLFAASSAPDTDFVVRLTDVHPDGRSIILTDGIVRASARESYSASQTITPTEPSLIEPGRAYEYSVDMWATAVALVAGHRLRVHVTSSCSPRWDRNPNTGGSGFDSGDATVAQQRVLFGAERPSRVTITTL